MLCIDDIELLFEFRMIFKRAREGEWHLQQNREVVSNKIETIFFFSRLQRIDQRISNKNY